MSIMRFEWRSAMLLASLLVGPAGPVVAESPRAVGRWAQFRGPAARGVSEETGLPAEWDEKKNVAWRVPVPGLAWSSPVVWDGKVFLTTAVGSAERELPKKGLYFGGNRPRATDRHEWRVLCLDAATGAERWSATPHAGVPEHAVHLKSSYASETPATDGERLYAYFGNVGLFAYDLDGHPLWQKRWPVVKTRFGWGTAASPVVDERCVYIVNDNEEQSWLVALDKRTGEPVWRVDRDEGSNWSTPYLWNHADRREIVTPGTDRVRSYGLDGKVLWELKGMSSITIMTPFAGDGLLYIASGYVGDRHRPLYAIRPGAAGDVSLGDGERANASIAWSEPRGAAYNPSPLLYRGLLYVLFDRGFLVCRDAATGKLHYKKRLAGDIGGFGGFTCSPWAYEGKVFCLNEDGDAFVVRAGPEYEVLGVNSIGQMCMASPAIAGGRLFIRSRTHLWCFARTPAATSAE